MATHGTGEPQMATEIPAAITIPDSIDTRLGTLRFVDGFPTTRRSRRSSTTSTSSWPTSGCGAGQGQGGRFLFVPPDHAGELPDDGSFVFRSNTFGNLIGLRGFLVDGDPNRWPRQSSTSCGSTPRRYGQTRRR